MARTKLHKILRLGDSLAVVIPVEYARALSWHLGDTVAIAFEENAKMKITKVADIASSLPELSYGE